MTAVESTSNLGATVELVDTTGDGVFDSVKYDPSSSTAIQNLPAGESLTDSVVYTITDEDGSTDQATLFYTVKSPKDDDNNPPDAVNDDQGMIPGDSSTTTTADDILGNDSDPDGDDLTITNISTTSTLGATITPVDTDGDGVADEFVYDPSTSTIIQNLPSDQYVTDVVEYTISDGNGGTDTAIITYNVKGGGGTGNGNPPIALSDDLGETGADTTNVTDFADDSVTTIRTLTTTKSM